MRHTCGSLTLSQTRRHRPHPALITVSNESPYPPEEYPNPARELFGWITGGKRSGNKGGIGLER